MKSLKRVFDSRELLWNLTLRELRTKYRRSFLGWAWSMLNPLATVAIYSFVFGVLFQSNAPIGDPSGLKGFAYFLLCALLPWNFFSLVTNLGMGSISANSGLVRRVAFPREVLVFSNVLHACVQFSIEIFASGFALALSTLSVYFRDITYLWSIFIQVWFFLTPVVYAPSVVQDRAPAWANDILRLNPMSAFVNTYRDLLYDATSPSLPRLGAMVIASFVSLAFGWAVFNRMGRRLPEEV